MRCEWREMTDGGAGDKAVNERRVWCREGKQNEIKSCRCWDSSPGLHGHNVGF